MTDELSPEFLAFSELLDQEESLSSVSLDENARLLLALRNELREGRAQAPELPSHFAASTAAKVVRRWQAQSSVDVALVRLEPWLRARLTSWRGLAGGTGLLALLGFAFYEFSLGQLALSGVLLGVLALSLRGLYSWRLPGTFDVTSPSRLPEMNIPGLYYLLPVAAVPAPPLVAQVPDDSEALDPVPALPGRWDDVVLPAQLLALAPGAVEIMEMTS